MQNESENLLAHAGLRGAGWHMACFAAKIGMPIVRRLYVFRMNAESRYRHDSEDPLNLSQTGILDERRKREPILPCTLPSVGVTIRRRSA